MNKRNSLLKLVLLSILVAIGVVISPIMRFEGMCPMAHFINIVASVLLGPWYSLLCAVLIGIIRMIFMAIPPIALTGAIFGAFLSGVFYRMSKGRIIFAVLGEVIGTGIIGAIISYPVMTLLWGKEGLTPLFYVPTFILGTLIGGSIAFVFLKKLSKSGVLSIMQEKLSSESYSHKESIIENAFSICATGVIFYLALEILPGIFNMESQIWSYLSHSLLAIFVISGIIYFILKKRKKESYN